MAQTSTLDTLLGDYPQLRDLKARPLETTEYIAPLRALPEDQPWSISPILLHDNGPFLITAQAGRGLHGRVFDATNIRTGKRVALKVDAPTALGRQLRDQRNTTDAAVTRADSGMTTYADNTLPRWERYDAAGEIFHEMSFMERFLTDIYEPGERMHWRKGVDKREMLGHITDIINGAAQIHGKWNVAYRDFKFSNCALTPEGKVLLTDFGLASDGLTASPRDNMGWIYMRPPENFLGSSPADKSYDAWNLGALIYRMCTGEYPLEREIDALAKQDGVDDLNKSARVIDFMKRMSVSRKGDWTEGDRLMKRKIYARGPLGGRKVPMELQELLGNLLRWTPDARPADGLHIQHLWKEAQADKKSLMRLVYTAAALPVLIFGAVQSQSAWQARTLPADEVAQFKEFKTEAHNYAAGPPIVMSHATREYFKQRLKQSYMHALSDQIWRKKIDIRHCSIENFICSVELLDKILPKTHHDLYIERYGKLEDYEKVRNYFINTAMPAVEATGQADNFIRNSRMYVFASTIGADRWKELMEERRTKYRASVEYGVIERWKGDSWDARQELWRIVEKNAFTSLSATLEKNPLSLMSEEDAKIMQHWHESFVSSDPMGYAAFAAPSDPRYR